MPSAAATAARAVRSCGEGCSGTKCGADVAAAGGAGGAGGGGARSAPPASSAAGTGGSGGGGGGGGAVAVNEIGGSSGVAGLLNESVPFTAGIIGTVVVVAIVVVMVTGKGGIAPVGDAAALPPASLVRKPAAGEPSAAAVPAVSVSGWRCGLAA